jgi:Nucleoside-diphosphate-sugar epimerases
MKILVTGSSGFIGGFLTRQLASVGHSVMGLDINKPESPDNPYKFIQGDILNTLDIMKAATGTDAIMNLAAKHHDFGVSEEEFFAVNVGGTKNLLDCADKLGIKKFIFYSTAAVYGNCSKPASEDTPLDPVNFYGKSKMGAEEAIREWANKGGGRQAVIIRPVVVFGPNNYANMHKLIESIHKKRFFFVGKGDNIKSIAYVENLVDATLFLMDDMTPPRCGSGNQHVTAAVKVYNYSDYPQLTMEETVRAIADSLGYKIPNIKIPLKFAMFSVGIFDILGKLTGINFPITAFRIKKLNTATCFTSDRIRALGFKQEVEPREGIRRMVEWYVSGE